MISLRRLPVWAAGVVQGIYFGVVMGIFYSFQDRRWQSAVAGGLVAGVLYGAFVGFAIGKRRTTIREVAGPLPEHKFEAAFRGSIKGPIPTDPEIRDASCRLVRYRLERVGRAQRLNAVVFGLFVLLGIYLVFTAGPIWWLAVVLFLLMGPLTYWQARRVRVRAALFGIPSGVDRDLGR